MRLCVILLGKIVLWKGKRFLLTVTQTALLTAGFAPGAARYHPGLLARAR
jgi:hypothetical protein